MKNISKMCSFYVNGWHLIIMILPYISKKINEKEVVIINEENLLIHVKSIVDKLNINEEMKERIIDLDWRKTEDIDKKIKEITEDSDVFVIGNKKYIENINKKIENLNMKLTIINCFEVMQFNQNMEEILISHDKILNTSGIKDIEEMFNDGNNKKAI